MYAPLLDTYEQGRHVQGKKKMLVVITMRNVFISFKFRYKKRHLAATGESLFSAFLLYKLIPQFINMEEQTSLKMLWLASIVVVNTPVLVSLQ